VYCVGLFDLTLFSSQRFWVHYFYMLFLYFESDSLTRESTTLGLGLCLVSLIKEEGYRSPWVLNHWLWDSHSCQFVFLIPGMILIFSNIPLYFIIIEFCKFFCKFVLFHFTGYIQLHINLLCYWFKYLFYAIFVQFYSV